MWVNISHRSSYPRVWWPQSLNGVHPSPYNQQTEAQGPNYNQLQFTLAFVVGRLGCPKSDNAVVLSCSKLHPAPERCQEKPQITSERGGEDVASAGLAEEQASTWQRVCQRRRADRASFPRKPPLHACTFLVDLFSLIFVVVVFAPSTQ